MTLSGEAAIAGLGVTAMGRIYGRNAVSFAAEAIASALDDAGLRKSDVDGLLVNANMSPQITPRLQMALGFEDLRMINVMNAYGSTAGTMLQYAAMGITQGFADTVVLLYADAPLSPSRSSSDAYGGSTPPARGMDGLNSAYGYFGPPTGYAMAAQRHMHLYGTTTEQLGVIAVGQRKWASMNPWAQMRSPMTLDDHQASRWIAEPLRLLDCCLVSNGAVAVVMTSGERARHLRQPPVYILGLGQGAPGDTGRTEQHPGIHTGATQSGAMALKMAGLELSDINALELYDCFTYTVLVTLEDYGFCKKGEGGSFVEDGKLAPGGSLPTNTGGGQLSGYYMWGFTPLSEAVVQARGQGGSRQVQKNDFVMVSGNGGILNYHSTAILSRHER